MRASVGHGGGCGGNARVPGSAETAAERAANPGVRAEAPVRGTACASHARDRGAGARARDGNAEARDGGASASGLRRARARQCARALDGIGWRTEIFMFAWQAL